MPETKVYFATNRRPRQGGQFGNDAEEPDGSFRVGHAVAEKLQGKWRLKEGSVVVVPETNAKPQGSSVLFPAFVSDLLQSGAHAEAERVALVFVHGAANSFDDAISHAGHLSELYASDGLEIVPFAFSYPTNGAANPLDYLDDRDDAVKSGLAMARAFARFVNFMARCKRSELCNGRVFLLCHSLGNYALRFGLQILVNSPKMRPVRLFDGIFLMAADADSDALSDPHKLEPLDKVTSELHVYFRPDNKLLRLSDVIHTNRLGQTGPEPEIHKQADAYRVNIIDARHVKETDTDITRHRYYLYAPDVATDIQNVLRLPPGAAISGRKPIDEKIGYFRLGID